MRLNTGRAAALFSSIIALANLAAVSVRAEDLQISVYGGYQTAPHSNVNVSDGPDFTAGWEGNSFKSPQYYGVRGTWWLTDLGKPNIGLSIDYTHAKVYADDETFGKTPGWTHFEFTDGLNLLTLNGIYRFQKPDRKWTPYIGAGIGINVPHVEVTRPSGKTFDYEFGGMTLQAQAGISYQISERWSVFGEYKGNYSFIDVPIDSGARLKTNILTNAVNLGVSFHF
ncbi:outer membrane protein [Rhizobium herbae]|uniref:Lipid A oxidase n=1 Tax=Rhizobium herbae TaxID=508661 RepID=A0ABS4EN94_9HYPH|nr:outer membrane beta-barrel protein [Rhizobium herbae]MBP1859406.1 lipid A oxidase [Rhizobium herbae]